MSEQITHYTPCCATCRHAEAGGPCTWRHDNADSDCCPDWEYGNHAAWLGDDTPYPMASREITAEPHGSMEEHTALCEHTRVESLPDRRKQLPHHVMVLHSQKGLLAAAALAYRYGKELHPAGTAAKLQELAKERDEAEVVRSDRRRAEVPECAPLSDELIDWVAVTLRALATSRNAERAVANQLVLALIDRGGEVLAAIEACRVTEAEAEPDPDIPYLPTWAISSLLHLLWIDDENLPDAYLHREVAAELKSKGLIRLTRYEHYALTPTGRALAKRFLANMRRKPPEPIGYSLRALLGLAWEYVHDARAGSSFLDAARAEGLLVGTYGERKPTDLGRKTWTDFLRRLGLPGDGSKPEPEPEPTLTESADGRREWWLHGKRHREDGPAIELPDGYRSWWLNGVRQPEPDKGGRQ